MERLRWGVWTGRFQPFHKGHLGWIDTAFEDFPYCQWIVVTSSGPDESQLKKLPIDMAEKFRAVYSVQRMPFSPVERLEMVRLSLLGHPESARLSFTLAPHYLRAGVVQQFYPGPESTVFLTKKDTFDTSKRAVWSRLGMRVHTFNTPGRLPLSSSEFRSKIRAGEDWRQYIVPTAQD